MTNEVVILDQHGRPFSNNVPAILERANTSLDDPEVWAAITRGTSSSAGVNVTPRKALGYPPLWRGICLIAGDVAKLPLVLYRRTEDNGKEPERSHAAYRLVRHSAGPALRASLLKKTLTYHALLYGNGYAWILRNAYGPVRMVVCDPQDTHAETFGGRLMYETPIDGQMERIPAEDMFHIRGLSHDGISGIGVLQIMADALGLGIATREFGARFFMNGANASMIIMVPGHFKENQIENTLRAWQSMAGGMQNAHKVAVLQDGVKVEKMTIDPEAAQMIDTRKFEVREVANILGVPRHKLGDDTTTSYSSLEAEQTAYLQECLDSWLVEWEEESRDKLLTDREKDADDLVFEFTRQALIRTDIASRMTAYFKQMSMGGLTPNDLLRKENMPTIGPEGDTHFVAANWVPLAKALIGTSEPANPSNMAGIIDKMIRDKFARVVKIDHDKAKNEAKKDGNLEAWAAKFYPSHIERVVDAIALPVEALVDLNGHDPEYVESVLDAVRAYYTEETEVYVRNRSWPEVENRVADLVALVSKLGEKAK